MKKFILFSLLIITSILFSACSNDIEPPEDAIITNSDVPSTDNSDSNSGFILETDPTNGHLEANQSSSDVDYDFTKSSTTIVYAQVYELVNNPTEYLGKTFKITGTYQSQEVEGLSQNLTTIFVNDAAGCCAQGLEIRLNEDITEPQNSSTITIEGIFVEEEVSGYPHYYLEVYSLKTQ